ncbi:MAG: hypothetical protein COB02_01265 [Candidatus Cloacimonadota bacterium]|nr:MAG: hypothetical protein COB02_01265 [Candidatus Cloacimonadota bacterium]
MLLRTLFLVILVSLQPLQAREYITQSQLQASVIEDLPGRIGTDFARERDPENMTANAISKIGSLLSNFSGITLGGIGGIAVLGLAGIISAPLAAIGAAAIGTLALVGTMNDPQTTQAHLGRSMMNGGMLGGYSQNVAFGAQSTNRGIMGNVFGVTGDRTRYGVGSLGVSSDQRAPVYVNMQSPHVNNVFNRGYNFASYDSGYTNDFGAFGPASATSSENLKTSNAPKAPGFSYNGFNTNRNYGGLHPSQMMSNGRYDRRGDQTFTNFFSRSDSERRRTAPQGNNTPSGRNRFSGPSYDVNWRNTRGKVGSSLSTSNQYAGKGFASNSPQGGYYKNGFQNNQRFETSNTRFPFKNGSYRVNFGFRPQARPPFQFNNTRPVQNYDVRGPNQYSLGNAYFTNNLSNNYDRRFQGSNGFTPNQGYTPSSSINTQSYTLPPQVAPGSFAQPAFQSPSRNFSNGVINMAAPSTIFNEIKNPEQAQVVAEVSDTRGQSTYNNSNQVMMGAMAPVSSFESVDELQLEKKRLYDMLLNAVHNNDEESRIKYFKQYSLVSEKLDMLLAK